jgi:hypothetical protein
MPIEVSWLIPQRVVYERFSGEITLDDIRQNSELVGPLMAEGIPLIHTIIDVTEVTSHPGLNEIRNSTPMETYDNEGWRILVGGNAIARFIGSVILQLMQRRFRAYPTMEEAIQFLAEIDDSLDLSDYLRDTGT